MENYNRHWVSYEDRNYTTPGVEQLKIQLQTYCDNAYLMVSARRQKLERQRFFVTTDLECKFVAEESIQTSSKNSVKSHLQIVSDTECDSRECSE